MAQLSLFKKNHRVRRAAPLEFATHCLIADTLRRWQSPGWRWTHFPAGEKRNPRTAGRLKRMGVARGWPDFVLLSPLPDPRAHFLEVKRQDEHLNEAQVEFQEFCELNQYQHAVVFTYADALTQLKVWGAVRVSVSV